MRCYLKFRNNPSCIDDFSILTLEKNNFLLRLKNSLLLRQIFEQKHDIRSTALILKNRNNALFRTFLFLIAAFYSIFLLMRRFWTAFSNRNYFEIINNYFGVVTQDFFASQSGDHWRVWALDYFVIVCIRIICIRILCILFKSIMILCICDCIKIAARYYFFDVKNGVICNICSIFIVNNENGPKRHMR